jgi:putative ABC transport system permease protein
MNTFLQDLRYGLRMLAKSPGFTAVAVLTLALGIGANTAIFSVVNAVLLRPLNFKEPGSLALVWEKLPRINLDRNTVAPPNFLDWQEQNRVFAGMAAFLDQPLNLTGSGDPQQVSVELVSPNFFSILGVSPMLGRGFAAEDAQPGKDNVVILSYALWESRYGGDRNIIGKTIGLNGESITVVGVLPPNFDWYINEFSFTNQRPQIWTPLVMRPAWRDWTKVGRFLRVVARVKPGISLTQAQAQMDTIAANLAARYPQYDKGWGVHVVPVREQLSGAFRPVLLVLLGAVGFVLLIACANISSLLLSRAMGRSREIAIRTALGATRRRIVRQLLTESILLGAIGGTVGIFAAIWATEVLVHAIPTSLLDVQGINADWRVLTFSVALTLVAGIIAGGFPALIAARAATASALAEGGRTSSAARGSLVARNGLIVAEISLALVLLTGSGLLIQSFLRLARVHAGFSVSHLLTFQVNLPASKYSEQARAAFFSQFLEKVRALPGVLSASGGEDPPFTGVGSATDFLIVGEPAPPVGQEPGTNVRVIEPDYFRTMNIPLLRGRSFEAREFAHQSNVVIINKTFADRFFPRGNALGQKVIIDMKDQNLPDEIVGVVGDVHESSLADTPDPEAYWPYPELPYPAMTVLVRTAEPPLSLVPAIRDTLRQLDKDQPIAKVSTMDTLVADSFSRSRFTTLLLSAFAAVALILACIGIYGVMAFAVTQRTNEFGIRMALGAQQGDVLRLVLGQGTKLALAGISIGIVAALALTRLMSSLLFGVSASDPVTFIVVAILLAAVALAACYIPARRAMKVDPMIALRYE